jgi:hypothetical protein
MITMTFGERIVSSIDGFAVRGNSRGLVRRTQKVKRAFFIGIRDNT